MQLTNDFLQRAIDLARPIAIKKEGFYPKAYKDPGSVDGLPITIGYGTTVYKNGKKVKLGDTITEPQAAVERDFELKEKALIIAPYFAYPLNVFQFAALISFAFNAGQGSLKKSGIVTQINNGQPAKVVADTLRKSNLTGKAGVVLNGLVSRRKMEAELFETPVENTSKKKPWWQLW